jgi:hypothetical protein
MAGAALAAGLALGAPLSLNSAGAASAVSGSQAAVCGETTVTAASEADALVIRFAAPPTGEPPLPPAPPVPAAVSCGQVLPETMVFIKSLP